MAGVCAAACLAVLVVAARLDADPSGYNTHTQLGLSACGFAARFQRPCITCGMTTSFAHAADARPARSLATQPAGAMLALLTAAGFWGGLHVLLTGSRLWLLFTGMLRVRGLVVGGLILVGSWAYTWITWPDRSPDHPSHTHDAAP